MGLTYRIKEIYDKHFPDGLLKYNGLSQRLDSDQKNIISRGYYQNHSESAQVDTVYLTKDIVGNSYILYGFSKLGEDLKLCSFFDLIGRVAKSEFLTQYSNMRCSVRLISYERQYREFNNKGYKTTKK